MKNQKKEALRNESIHDIDEVLFEVGRYEAMNRRPNETGYDVFPIMPQGWFGRSVEMLRESIGARKRLPDCGEAIWKSITDIAFSGNEGDIDRLMHEFRLWLIFQRGKVTFGSGRRPETFPGEESTSTSESSSSLTISED
jgi:hypothetical protein